MLRMVQSILFFIKMIKFKKKKKSNNISIHIQMDLKYRKKEIHFFEAYKQNNIWRQCK